LVLSIAANAQAAPNYVRPRGTEATPAPKVVFIGDQFTYMWGATPPFAANTNWINQGWAWTPVTNCFVICGAGTSESTAARFQADVIDLHPAIVHIMVGVDDLNQDDDALQATDYVPKGLLTALETMVNMAKAANIKVILGIEPTQWASASPPYPQAINSIIAGYGAQNNIPVVNYADALCQCVNSTGGADPVPNGNQYMVANVYGPGPGLYPTVAGYALMTQMAEVANLSTLGQTPGGGYLQNIEPSEQEAQPSLTNVNSGVPGNVFQFTPYGWYNNGLVEPFVNNTFEGSSGTWASSNPLVMSVSQTGVAWALSPGTAAITYTSPSGVKFNEWIMYIGALQ
jgi:GDSL-like Lipase/Acylhydrolase family/Bacterial Ig-like domain (group 2)